MARYECRVVPVGDASLRFEWYMNGVELKMGKIAFFNDKLILLSRYLILTKSLCINFRFTLPCKS